jgi:hypothetical protein
MRKASRSAGTPILLSVALGGWLACSPTAVDNGTSSDGTGSGGRSASGGTGGGASGGSGGSMTGTGGATGGTTGSGGNSSSGGSGAATGGTTAGGGTMGSGGAVADASAASGGATGSGGQDAAQAETGGGSGGAPGAPTFTKIYTEILVPGCTGPSGACHSVARDQYFMFAEGQQAKSHMLLVPAAPNAGSIPQRVMTLLNYVTPTNAANPKSVRMPPQSGANLGNPPLLKPPLTSEQIGLIRMWAMSGAKNN